MGLKFCYNKSNLMNKRYTFKISVYAGDVIYCLPGIKHVCEKADTTAEIYLWLDREWGDSVQGQKHPYGLNEYVLNMIRPLLETQPYIHSVSRFEGQEVKVDLDEFRTNRVTSMPYGSITRWPMQIWPDMQCDLAPAWLSVDQLFLDDPQALNKIIINRSARWNNTMMHYWFLRDYKEGLIFAGLPEEHEKFCKDWELDIPLLKVDNFLQLAVAMKSCRFFIGNQSMCFAIAEAMKIPRILEVCPYAPNVIPCGRDGYDALHQFAMEWLVKDLNSRL
jgi:hypothetical protein